MIQGLAHRAGEFIPPQEKPLIKLIPMNLSKIKPPDKIEHCESYTSHLENLELRLRF